MHIYCITNNINNKKYIGQSVNVTKRIKDHFKKSSKSCRALKSAIDLYGKDNFTTEILWEGNCVETMNNMEIKYIKEYNSLTPNGYNIEKGGGSKGKASEEKKRNQANAYNKNPELRKVIGELSKKNWENYEYRKTLSEARKEMWKDEEYRENFSNLMTNLNQNEEWKINRTRGLRELAKKNSKKVTAYTKAGVPFVSFYSASEAGKSGYLQSQVSLCCRENDKTHRKLYWRFVNGE